MDPEELYSEIEAELAPVKRGRGRPKGSKNKPKALPEPEPEVVPEPEPEPEIEPVRHVLDVSFESDEILGLPEPPTLRRARSVRAPRKKQQPPPEPEAAEPPRGAAAHPEPPVRVKRAPRIKTVDGAAPSAHGAAPSAQSVVDMNIYDLIKRELSTRRRNQHDEKSREYNTYFAW